MASAFPCPTELWLGREFLARFLLAESPATHAIFLFGASESAFSSTLLAFSALLNSDYIFCFLESSKNCVESEQYFFAPSRRLSLSPTPSINLPTVQFERCSFGYANALARLTHADRKEVSASLFSKHFLDGRRKPRQCHLHRMTELVEDRSKDER